MNNIPLAILFVTLIVLILLSGFFSGSETGLMSLNRYRLKHLSKRGHKGAKRASKLLKEPDKLIGIILLGNNFVNILASAIATYIATKLWGDAGIAISTFALTIIILIFAEVTPKTLATIHPEKISFISSFFLRILLKIFYPLVWLINIVANGLLNLFNIHISNKSNDHLSREELKTVVSEAGFLLPRRHQQMLVNILDLESVTVDDIMIPRNEIDGIDLSDDWDEITEQLKHSQFTRLPVFDQHIDKVIGFLHMRRIMNKLAHGEFTEEDLKSAVFDTYFVPEGTTLTTQLVNFQRNKRRIALVVNEYGDIQGLVTLEDILEEIVGEFTTDPTTNLKDVYPQEDGSLLINGSANIRDLNKSLDLDIPEVGPKTINGIIIEHLEDIPAPGTSVLINGYPMEIIQMKSNAIKMVRLHQKISKGSS